MLIVANPVTFVNQFTHLFFYREKAVGTDLVATMLGLTKKATWQNYPPAPVAFQNMYIKHKPEHP